MSQEKVIISEVDVSSDLLKNPLWFYIRRNKKYFTLGMIFLLITNGLDAAYPLILKKIIDLVTQKAAFKEVLLSSSMLLALFLTLACTRYLWRSFFGAYHTDSAEHLRQVLFAHLTKMDPRFFQKNSVGELMSLTMNDVQSFRMGIGSAILILVDGVLIAAFIIPFMIFLSWSWTWKTLVFMPLVPFFIKYVTALTHKYFKISQEKLASWSGFAQESISGIKVIKSFVLEDHRKRAYNYESQQVETSTNKTTFIDSFFSPVMDFGVASGCAILLFVSSSDILTGVATVGSLVAFQRYIIKMTWPMTALGLGISQYQKGMASFSRIKEILLSKPEVEDIGTKNITEFSSLEIRNLTFSYGENADDRNVLNNISFKILKGQSIGIVGPVGSGKSTLLNILSHFYAIPEETIFLNDIDIKKLNLHSLRKNIILVTQEPFLFSESIMDNAKARVDIEDSKVISALSKTDIYDELMQLPSGIKSELGERGVNLSGGQKQRLSLARGLLRSQSSLILLDDVLSAVDKNTEKNLIENLNGLNTPKIIVSHKISAVKNCDFILVLKDGVIQNKGTHQELLSLDSYYREIYNLQEGSNEATI